jgi:hypothetical protein
MNPLPLSLEGNPGELRCSMKRQKATAAALREMPVTMQGDRRSRQFQSAHLFPELRIWRRKLQVRILIVRNDSEDRLNSKLLDQAQDAPPPLL